MGKSKVVKLGKKKQRAKMMNTLSYLTPENDHKKLAENLGITLEEAEEMVQKFYEAYPAAIEHARMRIHPNFKEE